VSTPERVLGSDPLDVIRVTLSRQLRRVLFEAGLVDSPELPLYDARPEQPARAHPTNLGTDGAGPISRTDPAPTPAPAEKSEAAK
jgi:hypothetical protein